MEKVSELLSAIANTVADAAKRVFGLGDVGRTVIGVVVLGLEWVGLYLLVLALVAGAVSQFLNISFWLIFVIQLVLSAGYIVLKNNR